MTARRGCGWLLSLGVTGKFLKLCMAILLEELVELDDGVSAPGGETDDRVGTRRHIKPAFVFSAGRGPASQSQGGTGGG